MKFTKGLKLLTLACGLVRPYQGFIGCWMGQHGTAGMDCWGTVDGKSYPDHRIHESELGSESARRDAWLCHISSTLNPVKPGISKSDEILIWAPARRQRNGCGGVAYRVVQQQSPAGAEPLGGALCWSARRVYTDSQGRLICCQSLGNTGYLDSDIGILSLFRSQSCQMGTKRNGQKSSDVFVLRLATKCFPRAVYGMHSSLEMRPLSTALLWGRGTRATLISRASTPRRPKPTQTAITLAFVICWLTKGRHLPGNAQRILIHPFAANAGKMVGREANFEACLSGNYG
ncbi:hypothetical protein RRG08_032059 [Elysia crispata]|uniref:Uncharacterized protein n=1 Tax=Elysia crispata TaxID=231223 RepID=A0AAE0ZGW6_9GAST|nr:hypothetical protein RRG08_032059 [Elysia crispata]